MANETPQQDKILPAGTRAPAVLSQVAGGVEAGIEP